jgi:microcystin-dependent protein
MSTEPFIGEIKILGFNFAPVGYLTCQGQIMSIAQNTALFALIGTYYGGDGQSTFALPDLKGRASVGQGQGPGQPDYLIGEKAGNTSVSLLTANLPAHVHPGTNISVSIPISTGGSDTASPEGAFLCDRGVEVYSSVATPGKNYGVPTVSGNTGITGSSLPVNIMNPYLTINYSIAIEGIFPSRS